jgi:murein DD-endopeptidase MepM/ murein hydrolase activator NlpD
MGRALLVVVAAFVFCSSASAHTDGGPQLAFTWPAQGLVTSPFGNDHGRWHPGLDIGTLRSLDVTAAAPGVVEKVGEPAGFEGYGNIVLVRVTPTLETLYAHLAAEDVHPGDDVTEGEHLGTAGCTGWCTGTHLHFEVRVSGVAVSPLQFLG